MLSVQMVFVYPRDVRGAVDAVRKKFAVLEGDHLTWLNGFPSHPSSLVENRLLDRFNTLTFPLVLTSLQRIHKEWTKPKVV